MARITLLALVFAFATLLPPLSSAEVTSDQVEAIDRVLFLNASRVTVQARQTTNNLEIKAKLVEIKPNHYYRTLDGRLLTQTWEGFFKSAGVPAVLTWKNAHGGKRGAPLEVITRPTYNPATGVLRFQARPLPNATGSLNSFSRFDGKRLATGIFMNATLYLDDIEGRVIRSSYNADPGQTINGCVIEPYTKCPGMDLAYNNLDSANLQGADLSGANLTGIFANNSELSNAILTGANLTWASLWAANLTGASLTKSTLAGAALYCPDCEIPGGTTAILQNVVSGDILGTPKALPLNWRLVNGYLIGPTANLLNANLAGAELTGADLAQSCPTQTYLARSFMARTCSTQT